MHKFKPEDKTKHIMCRFCGWEGEIQDLNAGEREQPLCPSCDKEEDLIKNLEEAYAFTRSFENHN